MLYEVFSCIIAMVEYTAQNTESHIIIIIIIIIIIKLIIAIKTILPHNYLYYKVQSTEYSKSALKHSDFL